MKIKLLLLAGFLGVTMVSCEEDVDVYYRFDESTFLTKQSLWEEQHIQSYRFEQHYMSSATGPVSETIEVRNGIATSDADESNPVLIGTISDVYTKVLNDFNQGKYLQTMPIYGISVDVTYNNEYHFPEEIKFSTAYKDDVVGGAWYDLKISNFEILEE